MPIDAPSAFLVLFLVSLGLTLLSFALGMANLSLPWLDDFSVDLPDDLSTDGGQGVSVFNLSTLLAFLTWFGGAGFLFTAQLGIATLVAVALALVVGLIGAAIVFAFLTRVLLPGQTPTLKVEDYRIEGTIGRLTNSIRPGGTGELVFSLAGTRRVLSARSERGNEIARGTEVVVVRYDKGVAYVEPFDELLAGKHPEAVTSS
jgi:membrane protein implicated in regulation of membrane protease activity